MTEIIKFRGTGSDCVSRIYEKQLTDLKELSMKVENGRFATYKAKFGRKIYRINKDVFFEILDRLPETNLVIINPN